MKIRIKRTILVEVQKPKLDDVWDRPLYKWDELDVIDEDIQGSFVNLTTTDGDVYLLVPKDAYEVIS